MEFTKAVRNSGVELEEISDLDLKRFVFMQFLHWFYTVFTLFLHCFSAKNE